MEGRNGRGDLRQVRACPLSKEISTPLRLSETVFFQVGPAVTRATENSGLCVSVSVEFLGRSGLQSFPSLGRIQEVLVGGGDPCNLGVISCLGNAWPFCWVGQGPHMSQF